MTENSGSDRKCQGLKGNEYGNYVVMGSQNYLVVLHPKSVKFGTRIGIIRALPHRKSTIGFT
jgi:hypothetical protein